jgi:hypothetical protein
MGITFTKPTPAETQALAEALRRNGTNGTTLHQDPLTTGWMPGADEVTDDDVISAIQSVPTHYAGVGFDVRVQEMAVQLHLKPGVRYRQEHAPRLVKGRPSSKVVTTGTAEEICAALVAAGYIVKAADTPNGREVRATKSGFEVQPRNDNYWIPVATLAQALDAFENPAQYREGGASS